MSRGQQGAGKTWDDSDAINIGILTLVGILILMFLIMSQIPRINAFIGAMTWVHTYPFYWLGAQFPVLEQIPFVGHRFFTMSRFSIEFLEQGGYAVMNAAQRTAVLKASGNVAGLYYGPFLLYIALNGLDYRLDQMYRKRHSLETMIVEQSETWTTTRMNRVINPEKLDEVDAKQLSHAAYDAANRHKKMPGFILPRRHIDVALGPWSRSLRPEELLLAKGITFDVVGHQKIVAGPDSNRSAAYEYRDNWGRADIATTSDVLEGQLRFIWKGPQNIRPVHKAVFAVMACFYGFDIDGGNKLLNDLGLLAEAAHGKPGLMDDIIRNEPGFMARLDKIIASEGSKKLQAIGEKHMYLESAFPAMLAASRKDRGVLPPAALLWLKMEDRLLWYIVDNVGNEAIMAEASGALAHSRAEAQLGKKLARPHVFQAARSVTEDYLDMTEERIEKRREQAERHIDPANRIKMISEGMVEAKAEEDIDGVTG